MGQITLRPELLTTGGQAASIMLDEQYVGSFTAVYRESDALFGMIQLDKERLASGNKEQIDRYMQAYVQDMAHSLGVEQCNVIVTYSELSHILSLDDGEEHDEETYVDVEADDDVELVIEWVREEVDTLILDIYEQHGEESLYLGQATVNIGDKEMTVLVDFENPGHGELREQVAYHLVDLLEEEYQFETITITMQYNDEVIDEFHFDYQDQVGFVDVEEEEGPQMVN